MRLAVISGKGGTGKTTLSAALADLCQGSLVLADCDVDAANFGILFPTTDVVSEPYSGRDVVEIDTDACVGCGECEDVCRFSAVQVDDVAIVHPFSCEGCGTCTLVCPSDAISRKKMVSGEINAGMTEKGPLVSARLYAGSGNSGRMVHEVKRHAFSCEKSDHLIIDGPPGIGCPLMATVVGVDAVLMVTEPGISAVHDLKRLVIVCKKMHIRMFVAINRFDLSNQQMQEIEMYCDEEKIPIVGKIPFDEHVVKAVSAMIPVTRISCPATDELCKMWERISAKMPGV